MKKGQNKSGGAYGDENEKVKMRRTSQTFWNNGATLKAASFVKTYDGKKSWSAAVQDPIASG